MRAGGRKSPHQKTRRENTIQAAYRPKGLHLDNDIHMLLTACHVVAARVRVRVRVVCTSACDLLDNS